jgi:hypothetical protein
LAPPTPVSDTGGLPASLQALATSELAEQVEQIKITLESLNTEEISKLWTAFQAKYRPTAAYQVSVVLIQSKSPTRPALPVRTRNLYVVPFRNPVIDQIKSQENDDAPILSNQPIMAGHNLVLVGRQLRGDDLRVNVGGIEVIPATEDVTDTQIVVPVPDEVRAGVQGVQVIHGVLMGSPPTPHGGVGSNLASFVLRPRIEAINITGLLGSGGELRSADVELTLEPPVGATQRVVLLLNELPPLIGESPPELAPPPLAYSFEGPSMALLSPPAPTSNVIIPIMDVEAGTYLVRVQVDGAESPLGTDADGVFDSPQLTIP